MSDLNKNNLPVGWEIDDYANIVTTISTNGKKVNQKQYEVSGKYPVIDQGKEDCSGYCNDEEKVIDANFPILVFGDHTRAVKSINNPFVAGADGVKVLQPSGAITPKLLFYFTQYLAISIKDKGYARHYQWVAKELIGIPPENEQIRIVEKIEELFSELDKGIESLKTAKAQLAVYRQALLKHAFEGKLTKHLREKESFKQVSSESVIEQIENQRELEFLKQVKLWESVVKEWEKTGQEGKKPPKPRKLPKVTKENEGKKPSSIPHEWGCLQLKDIVLSLGQGWSPRCENIPSTAEDWGVIKTSAIQNRKFVPEENKLLPSSLSPRKWLNIEEDDILITRAGPRNRVGIVCRVKETTQKLMLCDKAYRVRLPKEEIFPQFIEMLCNTADFSRQIEELKTGISDSGLNITQPKLLGLYVPLPSTKEQKLIVSLLEEKLSIVDTQHEEIDFNIKKSEILRQSILKKAFSGKLVEQDSSDEPASELLKKIAIEKAELAEKKAKAAAKKAKA